MSKSKTKAVDRLTENREQKIAEFERRNRPENNKPAPPLRNWRVTLPDKKTGELIEQVVKAVDADEAWAKFCDNRRRWPSPRTSGRTIELIEE